MKKTIFLDRDIEVLVVSAGGVGTTFLIKAIGKYRRVNCTDDTDGFKHLTIPPISRNPDLKIIYLFGDPIMACTSLFRRSYHHTQSIKNGKYMSSSYVIPFEMTVEAYSRGQRDGLYFERHFDHWQRRFPIQHCLFVRYESIFDHLDTIADFLELPPAFLESFPAQKKRKTKLKDLDEATLTGLERMYSAFARKLDELPDTFQAKTSGRPIYYLLQAPYRRALFKVLTRQVAGLPSFSNSHSPQPHE